MKQIGSAKSISLFSDSLLVSTTCGETLSAGQNCKYTLRYTAKKLQLAAALLELTTLDPAFPLLKLSLKANRYPPFNDTGITRCGNDSENGLNCPVSDFPDQDAQFGRDKTLNVASNGKAGFNFTKLDANGNALPASAKIWRCVRDNVTGRVWERKPVGDGIMGNQGLHDADDTYTWYSTDAGNNNGFKGFDNPGKVCFGYKVGQPAYWCNTEAYIDRVNAASYCGFKDWRLPYLSELIGLVDHSVFPGPTIDTSYFPDTKGSIYWAFTPSGFSQSDAKIVIFDRGQTDIGARYNHHAVRLVRGDQ